LIVRDDPLVVSAGTRALVGEKMPAPAVSLLEAKGIDPALHRAKQLTASMVSDADLVLGLAREHRAEVARLVPSASRKTFTLLEYARIVSGIFNESLNHHAEGVHVPATGDHAAWLEIATRMRGVFAASPEEDTVVDPYRREQLIYDRSFAQILPAVDAIVSATAGCR
jgi:protein-tyrosine phosphatase